MDIDVSRRSGVALWRQIQERLEADIASGSLRPGSRCPSEHILAEIYGVNRHTVRRAIAALAEKGLVSVRQGRGTFICKEVTDVPVSGRSRLRVDVNGQSRAPAGRVLAAAEGAAPAAVAHALGLAEGDPVVIVRALGEADGRPFSLADHYYSARRFPGIIDACRRGGSIVQVLAAAGIAEGRRRLTRVGARLPDPEEAHLLAQPVDRPILICESVDVGADGQALCSALSRFAADLVQLVFET